MMRDYELFLGRVEPPHIGHKKILDAMTNPIVVIVKGAKTSRNTKRNPFSAEYQKRLLHMIDPNLDIEVSPNGFLPGILGYLRDHGKNVTTVYCGSDRIESYRKVVEEANAKMPDEDKYDITFVETQRITSATEVRKALLNNDYEEFKKHMPIELHSEFDQMRTILEKITHHDETLSFEDWLKVNFTESPVEEQTETFSTSTTGTKATTVTGNVAIVDKPLAKPIARRKKEPEEGAEPKVRKKRTPKGNAAQKDAVTNAST